MGTAQRRVHQAPGPRVTSWIAQETVMRRSYALWSTLVAAGFTLGACSYDRYPAREPSQAVSDSQGRLSGLGYYSGPLDGMWNPNTEAAIARFQHDRGLTATAQLDDTTWASLREASAKNAIDVNDASDVSALQSRLAQLGYYDGPLTGAPDTATQTALERFQRSRGLPPGPMTA
ncbi:MAG: peptidoglycan-binding domain-containing protein, partial [Candidatus Binataceae bacterium]